MSMASAGLRSQGVHEGGGTVFKDGSGKTLEGFKGKQPVFSAGKDCFFGEGVRIRCEEFVCGDNCKFHDRVTVIGKRVELGDNCWVGQDCILDGTGGLEIGNAVAIGAGSYIFTHMGRFGKVDLSAAVRIKDGAWLLPRVFVNPGVTIGENSRIDNCSLVTKDVEPNSVYRGSPATFARKLGE